MKGYATYKKIKNDNLPIPILDSTTGNNIGMVKKVRLTIKLIRSSNFCDIIKKEEEEVVGEKREETTSHFEQDNMAAPNHT
jgi:hypothetical protein